MGGGSRTSCARTGSRSARGGIGASYVGLFDEAIADAWLGFFMFSHADVPGSTLTPDQGAGAMARMSRVAGRASLLAWGAAGGGGAGNKREGGAPRQAFR